MPKLIQIAYEEIIKLPKYNTVIAIMKAFDYSLDFKNIDFRKYPEKYIVGKGEQGVLMVEPYKSEILPYWRFKNAEVASVSSLKILGLYEQYKKENDFVGMDMARKFIQMGFTRSRRYANHKSGKKYDGPVPNDKKGQSGAHGREILPLEKDQEKAASAAIFYEILQKVKNDPDYIRMKNDHITLYGS